MLALRRLLAGAAFFTLAIAPRAVHAQDTSKAATPSTHAAAHAKTKASASTKAATHQAEHGGGAVHLTSCCSTVLRT